MLQDFNEFRETDIKKSPTNYVTEQLVQVRISECTIMEGQHLSRIPPHTKNAPTYLGDAVHLRLWQDAIYEAPVLFIAYGPSAI